MSMTDEIKKALEPMTQHLDELAGKVDQLSRHVTEMEQKQDELKKQIANGFPAISEMKSLGTEAFASLQQAVIDIKDDLKKVGDEAVRQIKITKETGDDETDWLKVGIVALVAFFIMLAASTIPVYYWRYVPGIDYAYISFFNTTVSTNGKDGDLVIKLNDDTSEMNRKINEFYKRERERQQ